MNSTKDFAPYFDAVIKADTESAEIKAALQLADHYEDLLKTYANAKEYADTEETFLEGGVALASQYAIDCLRDPLRTTRFIAGTYQAVRDQLEISTDGKVNLLYAGCGPAAPLVLPFLHRFKPEELRVILMDITPTSINVIKELVAELNLTSYIEDYILTDAITYTHPKEKPLNVIVSETMDKGLTREPQVRVMQNLAPQLAPNGIFVPEVIDLYGEFTFYGEEPYFDLGKDLNELPAVYDTYNRQKLFSIDKNITNEEAFKFTSSAIQVPADLSLTPDAAVFAEIQVYKERILPKAKSLLSNSFCIHCLYGKENENMKYHYNSEGTPGWELLFEQ